MSEIHLYSFVSLLSLLTKIFPFRNVTFLGWTMCLKFHWMYESTKKIRNYFQYVFEFSKMFSVVYSWNTLESSDSARSRRYTITRQKRAQEGPQSLPISGPPVKHCTFKPGRIGQTPPTEGGNHQDGVERIRKNLQRGCGGSGREVYKRRERPGLKSITSQDGNVYYAKTTKDYLNYWNG